MAESRKLFDAYHAKLNPVDLLYERMFRLLKNPRFNPAISGKDFSGVISARINEFSEVLRTLSDSSKELPEAVSVRMNEMAEALARYRLQLSNTGKELPDAISAHIREASEALKRYRLQLGNTSREISETVAGHINEVGEALTRLSELSAKPI